MLGIHLKGYALVRVDFQVAVSRIRFPVIPGIYGPGGGGVI